MVGYLKTAMLFVHGVLMMATFAVSFAFFKNLIGEELSFAMPEFMNMLVGVGVIGISIASALFHVVGGGVLGATAGDFLYGMRIGLMLGLAYALGRVWIYAGSAFGASLLFWPDEKVKMYTIGLGLVTVVCALIQVGTTFIWSKLKTQ